MSRGQIFPEKKSLTGLNRWAVLRSRVIIPLDQAIAVTTAPRSIPCDHAKAGCLCRRHVPRQRVVFGLKCIRCRVLPLKLRDGRAHFSSLYQILPHEHAPDNQADDDEHHRKLDQREALLTCVLQCALSPSRFTTYALCEGKL